MPLQDGPDKIVGVEVLDQADIGRHERGGPAGADRQAVAVPAAQDKAAGHPQGVPTLLGGQAVDHIQLFHPLGRHLRPVLAGYAAPVHDGHTGGDQLGAHTVRRSAELVGDAPQRPLVRHIPLQSPLALLRAETARRRAAGAINLNAGRTELVRDLVAAQCHLTGQLGDGQVTRSIAVHQFGHAHALKTAASSVTRNVVVAEPAGHRLRVHTVALRQLAQGPVLANSKPSELLLGGGR